MTGEEIVRQVKRSGGRLTLDGDWIDYWLPAYSAHLVGSLHECKSQLIPLLRARGGQMANYPHCPSCASYKLKLSDVGKYECQRCGALEIAPEVAVRVN